MNRGATGRRRFLAALAGVMVTPLLASRRASAASIAPSSSASPIEGRPERTLRGGGRAALDAYDGSRARQEILYVVIDRPEDAEISWHDPNVDGLREAARTLDPSLSVRVVTIADLLDLDAKSLDERYRPLALFGGGSFTEWFQYGLDAEWRKQLDHWMELIRDTTTPMFAVCGSHQLVAIAFNGFSAVAHMNDDGPPVPIADELAASPPRGLWPNPRVGEEGTYPLVATSAGALDALVRGTAGRPVASVHHKDMVVDHTGFTLLYVPDDERAPASDGWAQARQRCRVQAVRRDDPARLLYTTQFHPEMCAFDESTVDDKGFGTWLLVSFLRMARAWWSERDVAST